jgi:uncharacterized protein
MVSATDTRADERLTNQVQVVPDVISVFALPGTVLLPGELLPLHVFEPRYRALTRDALAAERVLGVVAIRPGYETEAAGSPPLAEVGCLGFIAQHRELPDGRFILWLVGLEPFRIERELTADAPYRIVKVSYLPTAEPEAGLATIFPLRRELKSLLPSLLDTDAATRRAMDQQLEDVTDSQLVALACQTLELDAERKQRVLETSTMAGRFLAVFEDLYARLEQQPPVAVDPQLVN